MMASFCNQNRLFFILATLGSAKTMGNLPSSVHSMCMYYDDLLSLRILM